MNNQNLLTQLKGMHLPLPPGLWPMAVGWYILIIFITLTLIILGYLLIKKWIKSRARRIALKELKILEEALSKDLHVIHVMTMSILLRRVALAYFPRDEIAGLTGESWLKFLNKSGQTTVFTDGAGRLLISEPYKKNVDKESIELVQVVKAWIKKRI